MGRNKVLRYVIFISYAHSDLDAAERIYRHLVKNRLLCFFDKRFSLKNRFHLNGVAGGDQFRKDEETAISQSQKVLLVFSKNCYDGCNCYKLRPEISFELACAVKFGKTIIPFVIDGTMPNSIECLRGTSAIFVENPARYPFKKLRMSILKGITPVRYVFDEGIANFSSTELSANEGKISAQIELGDYFQFGKQVEVDFGKAIEWYEKAAKYDKSAYSKIGDCYLKGIAPFLNNYRGKGLDRTFFQRVPEIISQAKLAEQSYLMAARSKGPAISALFDLFDSVIWLCEDGWGFYEFLPDKDTIRFFKSLAPSTQICDDPQQLLSYHYRLCRLMYRLTRINGLQYNGDEAFETQDEIDSDKWAVAPEVMKASRIAFQILQKWSDAGEINARLFLASAYYWLQPESFDGVKNFNRQKNMEKAVKQLNLAYDENKDDIFRYNLREYDLYDVEDCPECLSTRLLHQNKPNPVGLQLSMLRSPEIMDEWEDWIKTYGWSQPEQLYLLGMGALRVNLSFAAKWLTLAKKCGEPRAERILADFYAENLSIYICGEEAITGAINNIFDQVELGASSCDPFLDAQAEEYKKKGYSLRQVSKTTLVALFEKNMSKAFKMYLNLNDKFKMGRCYYWGIGTSENKDLALSFGYGDASAEKEGVDFREWIKAIEEVKRERTDAEAWAEAQREIGWVNDPEEDVPYSTRNDEERAEEIEHMKRMREEYEIKAQNWRKQFPDLPCPYDYIAKIYKDPGFN